MTDPRSGGSFLNFTLHSESPSGKTRMYTVEARRDQTFLGTVSYYNQWRKYTFAPASDTAFDAGCLREIAAFCEAETSKQRARARTLKQEQV